MQQIVMPWRPSMSGARTNNMMFTKQYYESHGYEVLLSDSRHKTFNRSAARNRGVKKASGEIVVLIDADFYVNMDLLRQAIRSAKSYPNQFKPFSKINRLSKQQSKSMISGNPTPYQGAYSYLCMGGAFVLNRDSWNLVKGFDEDFKDWGCEDAAFQIITDRHLGPKQMLEGEAIDLWHPSHRVFSAETNELYQKYLNGYDPVTVI